MAGFSRRSPQALERRHDAPWAWARNRARTRAWVYLQPPKNSGSGTIAAIQDAMCMNSAIESHLL
ncbi:hypothetical protein Psi02_76170 [Planotetraspora silvatica]|uniref:Uncharacterized protein n=1 Tax=Planotetraspora silvatica TaxID=234614 RepID=A0A8J3USC9_9ACTN|nr:hypothetical protein Psi02_76170 [Planotetraspora silvatica]